MRLRHFAGNTGATGTPFANWAAMNQRKRAGETWNLERLLQLATQDETPWSVCDIVRMDEASRTVVLRQDESDWIVLDCTAEGRIRGAAWRQEQPSDADLVEWREQRGYASPDSGADGTFPRREPLPGDDIPPA